MANTENSRETRFRVIETLLLWEGEVDNQRLRTLLGVQGVQASRVLAEYAERNAEQIVRPSPRSPYLASTSIKPIFSTGSIEEYLSLVRGIEDMGAVVEDARLDLTEPMPHIFAIALQACRRKVGLTICYRSMTIPKGSSRTVFPHSVVRAGRRWHLRAWCSQRAEFRDFVIGRISSAVFSEEPAPISKEQDEAWNKRVPVVLGAHPALSADQSRVIRDEYFGGAVSRRLMVRSSLVAYTVQDLRAAIQPKIEVPPEFQLAIVNASELEQFLFSGKVGETAR